MKFLILFLISLSSFGYVPSNDKVVEADQIKVLDSTEITMKNNVDLESNDLTVGGTTTLDSSLTGVAKLLSGVVSAGNVDLTSEVDGILPVSNGGVPTVGTEGQILTFISSVPTFADAPISTTLDTKGQLQGFSSINANVGPCVDDEILLYDDAELTGWKCSPLPSTSPTITEGDLIYRGSTEDVNLPIGTVGQLLTSDGTVPTWQDAPVSLPDQTNKEQHILTSDGTVASWGADLPDIISQNYENGNVLVNPSFENDGNGWTITGCTQSYDVTVPLKKSLKLTCVNETFSIKQVSTSLIDFENQQGAYDLQIRTTADNVNVASITNGSRDQNYSVTASTTFKRFKRDWFYCWCY